MVDRASVSEMDVDHYAQALERLECAIDGSEMNRWVLRLNRGGNLLGGQMTPGSN
jgi:hypothetical protein